MRLVVLFLFVFSCIEAQILQTNRIEDTLEHLNNSTWLLLNLDDTLIEGTNQLGRVHWYRHEVQKLMQRGLSRKEAQKRFYPQWILSQTICPFRLVESTTASVIATAQRAAQKVLGLTDRHPSIAALSIEQLQKLQLDLSRNTPVIADFDWGETLYRNGVWFLADCSKAEAISRLLSACSERPNRIVLVDDNLQLLEEVSQVLESLKIEFVGIHYTKALERAFQREIAELQYSRLPEILSDREASALLLK